MNQTGTLTKNLSQSNLTRIIGSETIGKLLDVPLRVWSLLISIPKELLASLILVLLMIVFFLLIILSFYKGGNTISGFGGRASLILFALIIVFVIIFFKEEIATFVGSYL